MNKPANPRRKLWLGLQSLNLSFLFPDYAKNLLGGHDRYIYYLSQLTSFLGQGYNPQRGLGTAPLPTPRSSPPRPLVYALVTWPAAVVCWQRLRQDYAAY